MSVPAGTADAILPSTLDWCDTIPLFTITTPMHLPLTKAIVACLDRESARTLARLKPDAELLERQHVLEGKKQHSQLSADEQGEAVANLFALNFLADLQLEARGLLRRPAGSPSAQKKR